MHQHLLPTTGVGLCTEEILATNLALYLSIVPSGLYLIVNTQRHQTDFFPSGKTQVSHVLFFSRALISSFIAFLQCLDFYACSIVVGTSLEYNDEIKALAPLDRFPSAMFATGYLHLLDSFSGEYLFGGTPRLDLGGRVSKNEPVSELVLELLTSGIKSGAVSGTVALKFSGLSQGF
nr:hypothetical protein [Tanacetum cinerariifolium]